LFYLLEGNINTAILLFYSNGGRGNYIHVRRLCRATLAGMDIEIVKLTRLEFDTKARPFQTNLLPHQRSTNITSETI